jgi:hypothetical protein
MSYFSTAVIDRSCLAVFTATTAIFLVPEGAAASFLASAPYVVTTAS